MDREVESVLVRLYSEVDLHMRSVLYCVILSHRLCTTVVAGTCIGWNPDEPEQVRLPSTPRRVSDWAGTPYPVVAMDSRVPAKAVCPHVVNLTNPGGLDGPTPLLWLTVRLRPARPFPLLSVDRALDYVFDVAPVPAFISPPGYAALEAAPVPEITSPVDPSSVPPPMSSPSPTPLNVLGLWI